LSSKKYEAFVGKSQKWTANCSNYARIAVQRISILPYSLD